MAPPKNQYFESFRSLSSFIDQKKQKGISLMRDPLKKKTLKAHIKQTILKKQRFGLLE